MQSQILIFSLAACAFGACAYETQIADCEVRCSTETGCPDGLTCGDQGVCRTTGATQACPIVPATFPSCDGLPETCGPGGDESCCSIATPIPGGTFYRSYDVAADGMYPDTSHPATVSAFKLDKYEVTVGRFRKFVEASMGTQANPPPSEAGARELNGLPQQGGWDSTWNAGLAVDTATLVAAVKCGAAYQTWTDAAGTNEALPINCVTWYEAFAFCAWDGGFLPTEAEWNYVAAGGSAQRAYPWSNPAGSTTIDCSYANYRNCVNPPNGSPNRVGSESPKGDGRWGQADLAGNVWEWTLDWLTSSYEDPCEGCADLTPTAFRVIRGAGFLFNAAVDLRSAVRFHAGPGDRGSDVGFRCARP